MQYREPEKLLNLILRQIAEVRHARVLTRRDNLINNK
jgi:hypothetical protein